jgi:hypothetical protein
VPYSLQNCQKEQGHSIACRCSVLGSMVWYISSSCTRLQGANQFFGAMQAATSHTETPSSLASCRYCQQ